MTRYITGAGSICLALIAAGISPGVHAQSGAMVPETQTVITPVAPPAAVVTRIAPDAFVVTPVPGVAAATRIKVQNFNDYDLDKNGVYSPMEFAQALYFLATSDPVAGNPRLPKWDRFTHKGATSTMAPSVAVSLLNATADEFSAVDLDNNWRVSPEELVAVSLL